jgi:MraZ protein
VAPTLPPTPSTPKVPPARQETQEERPIQPLPVYRLKPVTRKVAQPLTGTFPVKVEQGAIVLPRSVAEQLGGSGVLLFTPGPDRCLWLTSRDTAKRLMERLEKSSLPDREVRNFRRIYFGESEKASLETGGRVVLPARLTTWAGFGNRLVLVGVDDHFELWDEGRWQSQVRPPQVSQTTRVRMQDTD